MSKKRVTATEDGGQKKENDKKVARAKGWFSARHQTDEEFKKHQAHRELLEKGKLMSADVRKLVAAKRSPQEQLRLLDERLGVGVGAKRERAKLRKKIEDLAFALHGEGIDY